MNEISLLTWAAAGGNLGLHRFASGRYWTGALMALLFVLAIFVLLLGLVFYLRDGRDALIFWGVGLLSINIVWSLVDLILIWRGRWSQRVV